VTPGKFSPTAFNGRFAITLNISNTIYIHLLQYNLHSEGMTN